MPPSPRGGSSPARARFPSWCARRRRARTARHRRWPASSSRSSTSTAKPSCSLALDGVMRSADRARLAGLVDADMAILVQPMLQATWGGVLFGADPVTGRRDRIVVAAVPGGPDQLVSGEVDGWTGVLDRRGRVREVRSSDAERPPGRRSCGASPASPARRPARTVARRTSSGPSTTTALCTCCRPARSRHCRRRGAPSSGPAPSPSRSPMRLSTLEQDLWLDPLRDGLREALSLTGTAPAGALRRSPLVVAVDGVAAADLDLLGADGPRRGVLRRLDPRPPARRLRAAWRVGRLRTALPDLGVDLDRPHRRRPRRRARRRRPRQPRAAGPAAQRPAGARQPARPRGACRPADPGGVRWRP